MQQITDSATLQQVKTDADSLLSWRCICTVTLWRSQLKALHMPYCVAAGLSVGRLIGSRQVLAI